MCITQKTIKVLRGPKWEDQLVACGYCWQCRKSIVNDYVGRGLAEAQYSKATLALTLTYAPRDDLADKRITPPHFQNFIRSLRDRHHIVRYLAVGEYGGLNDRAHFHVLLFFNSDDELLAQLRQEIIHKLPQSYTDAWPHGHVYGEWGGDERAIRYVCKYLLKGKDKEEQYWFTLSKKPAIGWPFFHAKALRDAELGVYPQSFQYAPPGAKPGWKYTMQGAIRRDYLAVLLKAWSLRDGIPKQHFNEWVLKSVDKLEKKQREEAYEALGLEHDMTNLLAKLDNERMTEAQAAWAAFDSRDKIPGGPFSYEALLQRKKNGVSSSLLTKEIEEWLASVRERRARIAAIKRQPRAQKPRPGTTSH